MSQIRSIWWLHPIVPLALPAAGSALLAWALPHGDFELHWKTWKFFTDRHLLLVFGAVAAFALGAAASGPFVAGPCPNDGDHAPLDWRAMRKLVFAAAALATAGYAIWLAAAISRGMRLDSVIGVFRGERNAVYDMKEIYLVTVSGLSTLTQFGVAGVILGALASAVAGWRKVAAPVAMLLAMAAVRSVLNSERLAMVELAVPGLVAALLVLPARFRSGRIWHAILAAPLIAPVLLFAFFTGSEYFRSWTNYYADQGGSLIGFGATRLSGYYLTAVNNSAYLLDRVGQPIGVPFFTASFLYRFPVLSEIARQVFLPVPVFAGSELTPDEMLANGANPEFNNPGGILLPFLDFGLWLGLFYWLAAGVLAGALFGLARRGHPTGLCLYPVIYLSLLEAPRILYWAEGRFLPPAILLVAAAWWLSRQRRWFEASRAWLRQQEGKAWA